MLKYEEMCAKANQYVDLCIGSDYAREQQVMHVIASPNVVTPYKDSTSLLARSTTIKLEHFERFDEWVWDWCKDQALKFNHRGSFSAHLFIAPQDGFTFNEHTDPDEVVICVLDGEKTMVVDGAVHKLKAGDVLLIPADVKHYAVNHKASIMISLGLERWMVDKL